MTKNSHGVQCSVRSRIEKSTVLDRLSSKHFPYFQLVGKEALKLLGKQTSLSHELSFAAETRRMSKLFIGCFIRAFVYASFLKCTYAWVTYTKTLMKYSMHNFDIR